MYKYLVYLFLISGLACQEAGNTTSGEGSDAKPAIDWSDANNTPQVLGKGIVSSRHNERDIAISPQGDEIFFTKATNKRVISFIMQVRKEGDNWLEPEVAPFSGQFTDLEPAFSPDGEQLFFVSNRPLAAGEATKDQDIWVAVKKGETWDSLRNIGAPVNTTSHEFYPSVASNGNLYYTARLETGKGGEDIYMSRFENGAYSAPQSLSSAVNSDKDEFNAYVSPDESYIIFGSFRRDDGRGGGDLYVSFKDEEDNWKPSVNLGDDINTRWLDFCPFVSADGSTFFFTSDRTDVQSTYNEALTSPQFHDLIDNNGTGTIYYLRFSVIEKLNQ